MKKVKFLSFWLLIALGAATVLFNSCGKDDNDSEKKNATGPITSGEGPTTDEGVIINGVKWATRNVAAPGTFALNPEDAGLLYQWNRRVGWAATGNVIGWNNTAAEGDAWEGANDPSPAGWRVPTREELQTLLDTDRVTSERDTINGVIGVKFTDIESGESIFFPPAGYRSNMHEGGALFFSGSHGYYWSGTVLNSAVLNGDAYSFRFLIIGERDYSVSDHTSGRRVGLSIRPVMITEQDNEEEE